jgi:alpha-tubulin suppressor-like RCC1 family protein
MTVVGARPSGEPAQAGILPVAAPAVQPAIQPAVLQDSSSTLIEGRPREDRRSLQSGITVVDGRLWMWGWSKCGAMGRNTTCDTFTEPDNHAPYEVTGLPNGAIAEATSGIYNYNAVDTSGHVWGWGSYANRDGTGGSKNSYPQDTAQNDIMGGVKGNRQGTGVSWPPQRIRIGGVWDDQSKPLLGQADPVRILSGTEMSGAAVTESGVVYSWGGEQYGGVGPGDLSEQTSGNNTYGALQVKGLPALTEEGNRPVQLEGGYTTYWLLLENGEVWYFGGTRSLSDWERAEGDQPHRYSGQGNAASYPKGQGQIAVKSVALSKWFRANNPDEHIVQVHSGISFGAALLSTGRVVTWGMSDYGAIGRKCPTSPATARDTCLHNPGYVDFGGKNPGIVSLSCSFTAVTALAQDGTMYGWGAPIRSYEGYPSALLNPGQEIFEYTSSFVGAGAVIVVDRNVVKFQTGQGFIIWTDRNGKQWGQGWQENGQIGHHGTNWGRPGLFNESRKRWIWFSQPQYEDCDVADQVGGYGSQPDGANIMFKETSYKYHGDGKKYVCSDLNEKAGGAWTRRFSLEQCLEGKCS